MTNNFDLLTHLIDTNGNCVNLGRNIKAHDSELCNWVMNSTIFLDSQPSVSFNERVFCILNNIQQPQLTAFGEPAKFINLFRGYSLKIHLKNKITNKEIEKETNIYIMMA